MGNIVHRGRKEGITVSREKSELKLQEEMRLSWNGGDAEVLLGPRRLVPASFAGSPKNCPYPKHYELSDNAYGPWLHRAAPVSLKAGLWGSGRSGTAGMLLRPS